MFVASYYCNTNEQEKKTENVKRMEKCLFTAEHDAVVELVFLYITQRLSFTKKNKKFFSMFYLTKA